MATALAGARNRARLVWLALLCVSFVAGLAFSWERWGNPLIDTGREMNQPLRLAEGETLYSDLRHIYGPLSPWLHAALFRAFGPSLTVLYADGIVSSIAILALVYWLGLRIMGAAAAAAATLSVMWLCTFRPAGNYILPYSYNALHGTVFSFIALAILVAVIERSRTSRVIGVTRFLLAGIITGLAALAKTEIGLATLVAGATTAVLVEYPDWRRGAKLAAIFMAPAALLTIGVYAAIASRVGWSTLASDSWLLLYNLPPELAYYNSRVSGFERPLRSVGRMLIAGAKVGMVAAVISAIGSLLVSLAPGWWLRGDQEGDSDSAAHDARSLVVSHPWRLLAITVALLLVMSVTTGLDWDKGPFLAMPFFLVAFLFVLIARFRAEATLGRDACAAILIVYTVYALVSLARMILHVRSGGAYGSFLLPISVVLFTHLLACQLPDSFQDARVGRAVRIVAATLLLAAAGATAASLAYRYRTRSTVPIRTARGTMIAEADVGQAWNEALAYIGQHTRPGDAVAVLPEGTSLDFLSGRRNPLREEIATPGFLDAAGEARAIRQLQEAHTGLILITSRLTAEFGPAVFGRDYCQHLMQWIDAHYTVCAMFGPVKERTLQIGAKPFFIRAYCSRAY